MKLKRLAALVVALVIGLLPALALGEKSNADAYKDAADMLQDNRYTEAAEAFAALGNYSDATQLAMYSYAIAAGESGQYTVAVTNLRTLGTFRDAALLVTYYQGRAYESMEQYESARETFADMTFFKDVAERLAAYPEKISARDYAKADAAEQNGQLETALSGFKALSGYSDSADRAAAVQEKLFARDYAAADTAEQNGQLESALSGFKALGGYSDSADRAASVQAKLDESRAASAESARDAAYSAADRAEASGDFAAAYTGFVALGSYRDSAARAAALQDKGRYALGMQYACSGEFAKAYALFAELAEQGYEDSDEKAYLLGVTAFADVTDKGNGVATFKFHDLYGLINVNTNTTIAPCWEEVGGFNALGLARVMKDDKYGYINAQGREVIACEWRSVSAFSGDYCTVAKAANSGILFGIVDKAGNIITDVQWQTMGDSYTDRQNYFYCNSPVFSQGRMKVQNSAGKWGFIGTDGQIVGKVEWDEIQRFYDGFTIAKKDGKYGFIDVDANVVIPSEYQSVCTFSEGLAAVQKGDKWQFINAKNEVVIQPLYTKVRSFTGDTTEVYLSGTGWQIIDKTGKLLYFVDNQVATDYRSAVDLMAEGQYDKAYSLLVTLPSYKDSAALMEECLTQIKGGDYNAAMALYTAGKYDEAHDAFVALDGYRDSAAMAEDCIQQQKEVDYTAAMALYTAGKYDEAHDAFVALDGYKDSAKMARNCIWQQKEVDYTVAKDLYTAGKYVEAYVALMRLSGYKDVDTLLTTDSNLLAAKVEACKQIGATVFYGHYEQDNDLDNGKEAIEWIVLDYDAANNRALVISRYALDARRYHDKAPYPTWSKSDIRKWLNSDFLNNAFASEEQAGIVTVQIKTNPYKKNKGGADTKDKIWLLSREEATAFFKFDSDRETTTTAYAKAKGAYHGDNGNCWWWLRSPGENKDFASYIYSDGTLSQFSVDYTWGAVRPAFWLDLSSF